MVLFQRVLPIFVFVFFCEFGLGDESVNSKRILLNDQDVVGQISRMENNIQSLTQLVSKLTSGMNEMKTKMTLQEFELTAQKAEVARLTGVGASAVSTYVRWGRLSCSASGTQLVYAGYAAGQHHYQYTDRFGGPANFLCMPNKPELSNLTTPGASYLYGTEFGGNFLRSGALYEDVPCAVCKSTNTYVSIMVPGRETCYSGWKTEYNGFLASDNYGHSASSFICVDKHAEYVPGGMKPESGRYLYFTQTACGSLSCPPYEDKKAVNCVVCSQ